MPNTIIESEHMRRCIIRNIIDCTNLDDDTCFDEIYEALTDLRFFDHNVVKAIFKKACVQLIKTKATIDDFANAMSFFGNESTRRGFRNVDIEYYRNIPVDFYIQMYGIDGTYYNVYMELGGLDVDQLIIEGISVIDSKFIDTFSEYLYPGCLTYAERETEKANKLMYAPGGLGEYQAKKRWESSSKFKRR